MTDWTIDPTGWTDRHTLHNEGWRATLEIDGDNDLCIEVKVDGDACDTREFIPMTKVVEFLRANGYEVKEPALAATRSKSEE